MTTLQPPVKATDESSQDLDTSSAVLINRRNIRSNQHEGPLRATEPSKDDLDKLEVDGIHQKGGKASSSALISGDDAHQETDVDTMNKTATTMASAGVEVAVAPIKKEFTALQQKIFDTENQLERLESKFYTVVSRRAVELEGINDMTEEEIE